MSAADELDPKSSLYASLAYDLRFQRQKRGLTGTQLGKIIGCVRSHVANLEACRARLDDRQAKTLDKEWDTGGHFERMLFFARTAHDPNWFRQYTQYEAMAGVIRIYEGQAIPVPLQVEAYARELLQEATVKDVDAALRARMERQESILARPDPPLVWVLLGEGALECEIGGPKVMRAQLNHLLELSKLPHVSIRLICKAAGAHPGLGGSFWVISLESRDIAYAGAQWGGRLVEVTGEAREFGLQYDRIGIKATSEGESRAIIERLMETYS